MSLTKSTTRRLSLLSGASLIAASLAAFGGLALAPTAAMAQATCTSPPAPAGNGTTAVTIAAGTYNPGITCAYAGTGSMITTAGAVTVSTLPGGDGVNLSATGSSAINWTSTAGVLTGGAQTNGAVLHATSGSGPINLSVGGVTATAAGTTNAILATASGAGNITITRAPGGAINNNNASSTNAIEARTNGGNIVYSDSGTGAITGRLRGLLFETSGAGSVSITKGGGGVATTDANGVAIDVVAGSGGFNMLVNGIFIINSQAFSKTALRVASSGAATLTAQAGTIHGALDFSGVTAGGVTVSFNGTSVWEAGGSTVFSALADTVSIGGTEIKRGTLANGGIIDFAGGNDTFTVTDDGYEARAARIVFGAGADVFNITKMLTASGTSVEFGTDADTLNLSGRMLSAAATLDFGDGADLFNLTGTLAVNGITVSNLESLNHSGVIFLGAGSVGGQSTDVDWTRTDGVANDVFRMTNGTFTGTGSGRVVMDVLFGGVQTGCATLTGAADCLDLRGAATAGETVLTLNNLGAGAALVGYDTVGITLVDVGGGVSAAGHFVLDPDMDGLGADPLYGDVFVRPGVFVYALRYDPATQRHVLVGLPRREALGYAVLSGVAQSVWHMTAQAVTDRQTDLRDGAEAGALWLRSTGEYTQRESRTSFQAAGDDSITIDNGYKLYAGTIVGGVDLLSGGHGDVEYVAGAQLGYVSSSFELNEMDSSGQFTGVTGGVYGSLWSDWFFFDGAVNINGLALDHEAPALGARTTTYVNSIGAAAETGVRTMLTQNTFAEPLVSLAWVRTSFEDISISGAEVQPADAESLRGALGMRLGATLPGENASATWFVTGRAWNELEGESGGVIRNLGADLPFTDEFTGAFGEAELGVNVFNASNTLSGFLTSGVKWKDGYSAVNLSLGVRMAW